MAGPQSGPTRSGRAWGLNPPTAHEALQAELTSWAPQQPINNDTGDLRPEEREVARQLPAISPKAPHGKLLRFNTTGSTTIPWVHKLNQGFDISAGGFLRVRGFQRQEFQSAYHHVLIIEVICSTADIREIIAWARGLGGNCVKVS